MERYEFRLPDIGEGVVEGEIVKWHVKVGDVVRVDDLLIDIMTDKANVEITAKQAGTKPLPMSKVCREAQVSWSRAVKVMFSICLSRSTTSFPEPGGRVSPIEGLGRSNVTSLRLSSIVTIYRPR